jgi:hypothetical protein
MIKEKAKSVQRRMWFGVNASVTNGPGFLHNAGFGWISIAAWEIMAEIITFASDVPLYRKYYEEITMIPRIIFWIFTGTLTITGWFIILF